MQGGEGLPAQSKGSHASTEGKPCSLRSAQPSRRPACRWSWTPGGLPAGYALEVCIHATQIEGPF